MHTEKYGMGNCGLLLEADRSLYKNEDTVSRSIIDHEKSHLNYNLCPHEQYKPWEIKAIQERIRGKKMRKDAVAFGITVITKPKDYDGDSRQFFETAYEGMKDMYGLRDEDVVSAYVHMDESTEHMHFIFIPVMHEFEKDRISWESVMPRRMYKIQHNVLQKYMSEKLSKEVHLLNGKTLGFDPQKLTAEQKKELMELDAQIATKQAEMDSAFSQFKNAVSEWIHSHDSLQRILRTVPLLSKANREKIEKRMEETTKRGAKAISEAAESAEDLIAAVEELERGKHEYDMQKTAAKKDLDIAKLLEDDGYEY